MKPHELKKKFMELSPDYELLDHLYKTHQKEYIRKRLKAIKLLWQGSSMQEIIKKLDIGINTIDNWVKIVVLYGSKEGLNKLAEPMKIKKEGKLSKEQQSEIIEIVETQLPSEYGYEQNMFTGQILVEIIEEKYGIKVTDQTVYNLLHKNHYSYQKAHRDYANADKKNQSNFLNWFKKN